MAFPESGLGALKPVINVAVGQRMKSTGSGQGDPLDSEEIALDRQQIRRPAIQDYKQ